MRLTLFFLTAPCCMASALDAAEASFRSVDVANADARHGPRQGNKKLSHHREAFASHVNKVLAMRVGCVEQDTGEGCLR